MKINLKDFYPYYSDDRYIDVTLDVGEAMIGSERAKVADERQKWRYRVIYSLNIENPRALENEISLTSLSTEDICIRRESLQELCSAISSLPEIQRRRIYAHYILNMSKAKIARIEGVSEANVRKAINRGLKNLENILEKFF